MRPIIIGAVFLSAAMAFGVEQQVARRAPIIDVHLHAQELWAKPGEDAGVTFGPVFAQQATGILAARSTAELQERTLAAFDRLNIVKAIVSGALAEDYRKLRPERILASPVMNERR